jgi:hypothetical protein
MNERQKHSRCLRLAGGTAVPFGDTTIPSVTRPPLPLPKIAAFSSPSTNQPEDGDRVATHDEVAVMDFEPVADFINTDKDPKKRQAHRTNETFLCEMWRWALVILSKSKSELIEASSGLDDECGIELNLDLIERMADAAGLADDMAHMLHNAELRLIPSRPPDRRQQGARSCKMAPTSGLGGWGRSGPCSFWGESGSDLTTSAAV